MSKQKTLKQILKALEDIDRRLTALEARPVAQPLFLGTGPIPGVWPTERGSDPWVPTPTITTPVTGDPLPLQPIVTICGTGSHTCPADDKHILWN